MKQRKVLLIEDNQVDLRVTEKMLTNSIAAKNKKLNLYVESAKTLAQGIAKLKSTDYQLILLDLGLPDSWGIDTFTKVFTIAREIPIIILSSLNDEGIAFMTVENGAHKYLVKGIVDDEELIASVLEACP